jgi:GDP-D-mannose 3',5'-epimerase
MKTVVTGAAGFIGANLVRRLVQLGRDIRCVDNMSRGKSRNLEGLPVDIVYSDLRQYDQALKAVDGADVVYHLAARVGSIDFLHGSSKAELEALQSNLAIDVNVFRACREVGVKKIVYASSVSVYPIDRQQKLGAVFREEDIYPINPEGGYGWAKLMGEIQLGMMEECRSAVARIFNAYGEYCEYDGTAQVVPALIRKAIRYPEEEFVVWGNGSQTRNLIYIQDCIDALLKMEEKASYPPLILNVGNEKTTTISELAETIVKVSGKRIEIRYDKSMPVGPLSRIPSIERATEKLKWKPRTSLENGLRSTYKWIESELLLGRHKDPLKKQVQN